MKKIFLIIICVILFCSNLFAGNFELINGRSAWRSALKSRASIYVEFDWSKCKYDNDELVKEYWEEDNYEEITDKAFESFIQKFNDKTKCLKIVDEQKEAEYKMVINMTNVDSFFSVICTIFLDFIPPGFKGKIWGTVKVIEVSSGNTIMEAEFDKIKGRKDFVRNDCYAKAFKKLAKKLTGI